MLNDLYQEPMPDDMPDTGEETNADYDFATGSLPSNEQLDEFMKEFSVEKEDKGCPLEPEPEDYDDDLPMPDEESISTATARNTAEFIVSTIDEGAAAGLSFLSKEPADNFRAGKMQRKNLEDLFTKFCKERGTEIPLVWQIFFCLATVYGSKIPYAMSLRKQHQAEEELAAARRALERDRAEFEEMRRNGR